MATGDFGNYNGYDAGLYANDPGAGGSDGTDQVHGQWWQLPRPSYVPPNMPWPPALAPGDTYGPNPGQIIKAPGSTSDLFKPGTNVTPGVDLPLANPVTPAFPTNGPIDPENPGTSDPGTYGQGGAGSGFAFPEFNPSVYQPGPAFQPGQFGAPQPFSFGDFKYDDFHAPTLEEARNQPGFQFALEQGRKALENSSAARGVVRTGGSLKDLFSWGDKFGEQNYGNVFNQDLQGYTTNRANAFGAYSANREGAADAYKTNYGISKDVFDTNYGGAKDAWTLNNQSGLDTFDRLYQGQVAAFNPKYNTASLKFSDLYNRDRDKLDALTKIAGYGA